jgi:hypothetical protein
MEENNLIGSLGRWRADDIAYACAHNSTDSLRALLKMK